MQIKALAFILLIKGAAAGGRLRGLFNSISWTTRHLQGGQVEGQKGGRQGGSGGTIAKSNGQDGTLGNENQMSSASPLSAVTASPVVPNPFPTHAPSPAPSSSPTGGPIAAVFPSAAPSSRPTNPFPSPVPSPSPSDSPSASTPPPTTNPTVAPSTLSPTIAPITATPVAAAPTPQSKGPTASPTNSPQPSPSPSSAPIGRLPSTNPTDSPRPSPAPSSVLTISMKPTPKPNFGTPTASPLPTSPSAAPTGSPAPTPTPSSNSPTVLLPSMSPTDSPAPSPSPSNKTIVVCCMCYHDTEFPNECEPFDGCDFEDTQKFNNPPYVPYDPPDWMQTKECTEVRYNYVGHRRCEAPSVIAGTLNAIYFDFADSLCLVKASINSCSPFSDKDIAEDAMEDVASTLEDTDVEMEVSANQLQVSGDLTNRYIFDITGNSVEGRGAPCQFNQVCSYHGDGNDGNPSDHGGISCCRKPNANEDSEQICCCALANSGARVPPCNFVEGNTCP